MSGTLTVSVQRSRRARRAPPKADLVRWAQAAWLQSEDAELAIRIVDENESLNLNSQYRHKNKPTNVLSFPLGVPEEFGVPVVGDLVICASVVYAEAEQQGKSADAHWAHMVVHGTLHLQGYDHEKPAQAEEMEQLERNILKGLGYANPY